MEHYSPLRHNPTIYIPKVTFKKDPLNPWFYKFSDYKHEQRIEVYVSIFIVLYETRDKTVNCLHICDGTKLKDSNFYNKLLPQWKALSSIVGETVHTLHITYENLVDFSILNSLINNRPVLSKDFDTFVKAIIVSKSLHR